MSTDEKVIEAIKKATEKTIHNTCICHSTSENHICRFEGIGELDLKALATRIVELEAEVGEYKAMVDAAGWIDFENGNISQPCSQPEGKQCWHDQDENLFDTALEAFKSLQASKEEKDGD